MELTHTFTVDLPPAMAWTVLTDLERVAACLPGAALDGLTGDGCRGSVRLKVGPVTARYQGTAWFLERDEAAGRAVIRAEGRDAGGQGGATATVIATLRPRGSGTEVGVLTELALSGRIAQFGRGIIADVSGRLLGQFVRQLESEIACGELSATVTSPPTCAAAPAAFPGPAQAAGPATGTPGETPAALPPRGRPAAPRAAGHEAAVDLAAVARGALAARLRPALTRALPAAAVLAIACGAAYALGRRSGKGPARG